MFETIAVIRGQPCLWQRHMHRLQQGCQRLGLPPVDTTCLLAEAQRTCAGHARAVLKIIVSTGYVERGYQRHQPVRLHYYLRCHAWPDSPLYQPDTPIHLQLCQTRLGSQPLLAGIKHLNRLEQVLARNELAPEMAEGVMLNQRTEVIECTMTNLLIQFDGHYITPPIADCGIAGIVRGLLIDQAAELDQPLRVATLSLAMLQQAQAVYLMNSLLGIRPVASYAGKAYPQTIMPVWLQQVSAACFALI